MRGAARGRGAQWTRTTTGCAPARAGRNRRLDACCRPATRVAGRLSSRHAALRTSRLCWIGGTGDFKRSHAHLCLWTVPKTRVQVDLVARDRASMVARAQKVFALNVTPAHAVGRDRRAIVSITAARRGGRKRGHAWSTRRRLAQRGIPSPTFHGVPAKMNGNLASLVTGWRRGEPNTCVN